MPLIYRGPRTDPGFSTLNNPGPNPGSSPFHTVRIYLLVARSVQQQPAIFAAVWTTPAQPCSLPGLNCHVIRPGSFFRGPFYTTANLGPAQQQPRSMLWCKRDRSVECTCHLLQNLHLKSMDFAIEMRYWMWIFHTDLRKIFFFKASPMALGVDFGANLHQICLPATSIDGRSTYWWGK